MSEAEAAPEPTHDVTSISETGEMHSEAPQLTTQELTAPSEAYQGAPASAAELPAEIAASDQQVPYFAPGAGLLEEEELLEEDEEFTTEHSVTLQGSAAHEQVEQLHEQETLEGAADLATMIREMSIDQITRAEAEPDEDFEEDFLEEDQDYDEEDAEGEESPGDESDERDDEDEGSGEEQAFGEPSRPQMVDEFGDAIPQVAEPAREPRRG